MISVKVVLRKKKRKDETYPLAIRITKDRRSSYIHLSKHIKETDWDADKQTVKKSHPNSQRLNNYLIKKLSEATDSSLALETQTNEVSSRTVKQKIKPSSGSTFFAQAELYLETLRKSGKYNRYTADKPRIKHFREFLKGDDIAFSDITISLLEKFKIYLKSSHHKKCSPNKKDVPQRISERTIMNHLVVIRSVFSQAIKETITDKKFYPFGSGKIAIKFPDSNKIGLSREEVERLEKVELEVGSFEKHCLNLWLFSFYLAGMRASDILRLKWPDIQNERLHYAMGKNAKAGSLKLPEKALKILNQYKYQKRNSDDLIFPDLKRLDNLYDKFIAERTIAFAVSRIDKFLKKSVAPLAEIEKPLTMHIARHTFGNISGDKIPIQMLQKLYRHSSIITTIGYQGNFIHRDADEALNAVINF